MKRWLSVALAALVLPAGCSQAPTEQAEQNQFDLEFGGLSTSNEAPGFGDQALLSSASEEVDPFDPVATAIQSESGDAGARPHLLALRVIWGQMCYDPTNTTATVWDGTLSVSVGRIGIVRTIRFEPATDYLLPRTDPAVVAWASQTTVHNDGLLCVIGLPRFQRPDSCHDSMGVDTLPPPDSLPPLSEIEVVFETGPLAIAFSLEQLLSLDTVIAVDERGNVVMFNGTLVRPGACPRGFLGGQWTRNAEGTEGEFRGRWMSEDGHLNGHLMGEFGVNSNGRRVFFGKFIDETGRFEGLMRGVWRPSSDRPTTGSFKGVFYDPLGLPAGRLHGRWVTEEPGTGTFEGVWKIHCPLWDNGARGWARWDDEQFDEGSLD